MSGSSRDPRALAVNTCNDLTCDGKRHIGSDLSGSFKYPCPLTPRHEVPAATGAGDDNASLVKAWLDEPEGYGTRWERLVEDLENGADITPWLISAAALRAQPQAREEAQPVGYFQYVEVWDAWEQVAKEFEGQEGLVALYRAPPTQPLAEGADAEKLRAVLEGFVSDLTGGHPKARASRLVISHDALSKRIDQALAALQQEGVK